ncbi:MAG: serine/threonine protein kinase [Candidatus Angelobacter sp.]|jgi:serine/threonine protein kinase/class 3 adenylate cyclase|nr:serine/threonine protein kinase [Candidatus Angelobacter sp.]
MSIGLDALLANRTDIDAELQKHKSPITVMFTDLAGSTSFFEHFGDTVGVAWLEEHNDIVIPKVKEHNGVLVKTIGDSVMAYFTDSKQATLAAAAIQRGLFETNAKRDEKERMHVRVALHHGLGYLKGGDIFGDVVNVAARIAKSCLPAQILVSEAVYLSSHDAVELKFESVGAVQFHGKSSKENLFEVLWTDADTYAQIREKFPPKKQATAEDFTGGRYIMMNELGRGAMGVVYKAYDRVIGRLVALKTIPLEVEESERVALVDRLKAEARTAGILDHPNIVTVFDVGEEAGLFYFTMQHIEGRTLAQVKESKELLPLDKIFTMADEICAAMAFAHKGSVIHRDLKPSNLMLTTHGTIKVMDFGIAKLGDSGLTKAGMVLGTPSYLAPEQASGRRIDHRADIFSLGAVLYELFTGEKAFPGESATTIIYKVMNDEPIPPRVIEPSLPIALDGVIRKAMAKDPNQRYQTCDELRDALRQCQRNPAFVQASPTAQDRTVPLSASASAEVRKRVVASSSSLTPWLAAGAAVLVLGGGFLFWQKTQTSSQQSVTTEVPAAPSEKKLSNPPASAAVNPAKSPETNSTPTPHNASRTRASAPTHRAAVADAAEPASAPAPETGGQMWSLQDVPNLMGKADGYAGKGDYQKAIFLYEQILKVDPQSRAAKEGLQRARDARNLRR